MEARRLEWPANISREQRGWGRTVICLVHEQSHQRSGTSRSTFVDFCARFMIQEIVSSIELQHLGLLAPVADAIGFSVD